MTSTGPEDPLLADIEPDDWEDISHYDRKSLRFRQF
jgi:hypothetical protein